MSAAGQVLATMLNLAPRARRDTEVMWLHGSASPREPLEPFLGFHDTRRASTQNYPRRAACHGRLSNTITFEMKAFTSRT